MTKGDFEVHDIGTAKRFDIQEHTIEEQRKEIGRLNRLRDEQNAALTSLHNKVEELTKMLRDVVDAPWSKYPEDNECLFDDLRKEIKRKLP